MQKNPMFKLEYSYLSLPGKFYQLENLASFSKPEMVLLNDTLLEELNIPVKNQRSVPPPTGLNYNPASPLATRVVILRSAATKDPSAYRSHVSSHATPPHPLATRVVILRSAATKDHPAYSKTGSKRPVPMWA